MQQTAQTIGDRIKQLRTTHGETQKELGDVIGKSRDIVAGYESNRIKKVEEETLKTIARHYHSSVAYLRGETSIANEPVAKYVKMTLIELVDQLPESKLKKRIKDKVIDLLVQSSEQKDRIIELHDYKDQLLKILRENGFKV